MSDLIVLAILGALFTLTVLMIEGMNRMRGGRPQ